MRFTPLFLLAFVSLAGLAQQNSGPVSTIQTTTREVVLDVVVTTKDNHPVSGLAKDDFVIEEDKAPQITNSFRAVSPITFSDSATQGPETILLVDQMNTRFPDFAYLRYCMKKLLARNGGHLAQPTTLMALTDKGLKVLAGPTRDGAALESAMEHLHAAIPWRLELPGIYPIQERINLSLGALAEIAVANAGAGARKNIVWISPGFPIFTSLDISSDDQQALFNAIRALSDELLRARISIYTIDPRGVFSAEIYSSNEQFNAYLKELQTSKEVAFGDLALQTLAVQTGGRALYGRNDVDQEIADSMATATRITRFLTLHKITTSMAGFAKSRSYCRIILSLRRARATVTTLCRNLLHPQTSCFWQNWKRRSSVLWTIMLSLFLIRLPRLFAILPVPFCILV